MHAHQHNAAHAAALTLDPVCGMRVDPAHTPHKAQHDGQTHFFCSAGCREKFIADPTRYLKETAAAAPPVDANAIYTCPMHPEVRQIGPGACPICGMALEPLNVTAEAPPNAELIDMKRRFRIGLALTLPVFVLEMGAHLVDMHGLIPPLVSHWAQLVLATPVVLWAGWPFFVRAYDSLRTLNLNMFTLIAMGTGTDVAIESAGVTLLRGDLRGIVKARRLSHATMRNIRQNLFFAFAYNTAGVPIAAGVLYPALGLLLSPAIAAAAMALSSVSVIANALRLRVAKL